MSEENNEKQAPAAPPLPRCGFCGVDLIGIHVVQMTLPRPDKPGVGMAFSLACCPNLKCRAVLPAAYSGEVEIEQRPGVPNIWTPGAPS